MASSANEPPSPPGSRRSSLIRESGPPPWSLAGAQIRLLAAALLACSLALWIAPRRPSGAPPREKPTESSLRATAPLPEALPDSTDPQLLHPRVLLAGRDEGVSWRLEFFPTFLRPIDLNLASSELLESLPFIGPVLAQRIVEERGRAPFRTLDDLMRVPGIGPATVARLEGLVQVGEAP